MRSLTSFLLLPFLFLTPFIGAFEILTSSFLGNEVLRYDENGNFIDVFASGNGLGGPAGMAIGLDGNVYIAGFSSDQIHRYDQDGNFIDVFASGGPLNGPNGVDFDSSGRLYVANHSNGNVLRYNNDGSFDQEIVSSNDIGPNDPHDIAIGPNGNIFAVSRFRNQVLEFDLSGNLQRSFGGSLSNPRSLTFDATGDMYVSSLSSNQVLRYSTVTGAELGVFTQGNQLSQPYGMGFGPDGLFYVNSIDDNINLRFDANGNFVDSFTGGGLNSPDGLLFINLEAAIPEPSSFLLLSLAMTILWTSIRSK